MPKAATSTARALLAILAIVAATLVFAPSALAKGCVDDMLDDWSADGRVDEKYALECYDRTLAEMPRDLFYYSNAPDAIREAKDARLRRFPQGGPSDGDGDGSAAGGPAGGDGGGPLADLLNLGPSAADDLPLPLLILGLVALLLMGAGAAGLVSRHLQGRRVPAAGPPDDPPGAV